MLHFHELEPDEEMMMEENFLRDRYEELMEKCGDLNDESKFTVKIVEFSEAKQIEDGELISTNFGIGS